MVKKHIFKFQCFSGGNPPFDWGPWTLNVGAIIRREGGEAMVLLAVKIYRGDKLQEPLQYCSLSTWAIPVFSYGKLVTFFLVGQCFLFLKFRPLLTTDKYYTHGAYCEPFATWTSNKTARVLVGISITFLMYLNKWEQKRLIRDQGAITANEELIKFSQIKGAWRRSRKWANTHNKLDSQYINLI